MTSMLGPETPANPQAPALYLERCDPSINMSRFYALSVHRTLFPGEWVLVRRWGRIGTSGSRKEEWFSEHTDALKEQELIASRKIRRGYNGS